VPTGQLGRLNRPMGGPRSRHPFPELPAFQ
jgi:hypothetical protein